MKETGFPSPFMDIMMLSPASRTSAIAAWKPPSTRAHHLPGQAEVAHHLLEPVELLEQRPSSWPWNSTMSRLSGSPRTIWSMVAR
jgi:hypothetical protein